MLTVLVIDDNENILISLKYVLRFDFDKVITLPNPDKLMATLMQEKVSVILLDMNFSLGVNNGSEGLSCLQHIRQQHPDIPVVLFTAYGDIDLAVRGVKAGAFDFVVKPWDNAHLISTLLAAVESSNRISTLDEMEDEHIRKAIDKCHGNLTQAAEILGITRQTLYNKLKRNK